MSQVNPYQSPRSANQVVTTQVTAILAELPANRWHEVDVRVVDAHRGWWTQRVVLSGSINAEIKYDPIGNGETVYVDNQILLTTSPFGWALVQPHIEFYLESLGFLVPASIDVKASFFLAFRTTMFRLNVAGKTVYDISVHKD